MTPLDRVIDLLKTKGFRDAQQPFGIGSATFKFDAVLTADKTLNLVILQDTTVGSIERLRRELLAFGRSLDVLGSRRTLTLVLVGQRIDADVAESLSQVCRLLTVSATSDDAQLRDSLAVLLPLELPTTIELQGDWGSEVRKRLPANTTRVAATYLAAAEQGEAGVRHELRRRIDRALSDGLS
ncbi:hypothetical protein ASE06_09370 [Sphingopyxis sp. Root214]|uniref:hypothetical protein n=1 Tax=unclassified Sphingopyxis TaxID=2614943 RepID=UPI0006FB29BF|nr:MULTISPECIES: hypothetical protein [unclassified Sphingopyxis]KQZ72688.1 hypothetical protein ASD73_07015 [Sphingopyxis sp. Root154]KRC06835.1 hypothetical protein ASE06_09370 [Sphingopyxis sp. Root214]